MKPILVRTGTGPEPDVDLLLIVTFDLSYILGIHNDNVIKSPNLYGGFVSLIYYGCWFL